METLKEAFRPKSLRDVVGQPCVRQLQALARNPRPCCIALESSGPGTGKTTCAHALANDLGCKDGWLESVYVVCGANFDAETARHYFGPESPFRFVAPGKGYHCLIVEELEYLHPQVQIILKDALERILAKHKLIVVATSNDMSKLSKALRQRFQTFFMESGPCFADAFNNTLPAIWEARMGAAPMPAGWQSFGYDGEEFSARLALDMLERYMHAAEMEVAVA